MCTHVQYYFDNKILNNKSRKNDNDLEKKKRTAGSHPNYSDSAI